MKAWFTKSKKAIDVLTVVLCGFFTAIIYKTLIFPNAFVPIGIDGICYVLQEIFYVDIGFWVLILSLPTLILALCRFDRKNVLCMLGYLLGFSLTSIVFSCLQWYPQFYTGDWLSLTFAPTIAGVLYGVVCYFIKRTDKTCCAMQVVVKVLNKRLSGRMPYAIIFVFNLLVTMGAIFIFGNNVIPIIYSLTYLAVASITTKCLLRKKQVHE